MVPANVTLMQPVTPLYRFAGDSGATGCASDSRLPNRLDHGSRLDQWASTQMAEVMSDKNIWNGVEHMRVTGLGRFSTRQ